MARLQQQFVAPHRHGGLSVRKLVRDYFELRVGLELWLVFKMEKEAGDFCLRWRSRRGEAVYQRRLTRVLKSKVCWRIDSDTTNTYNCAMPTVFENLKGYRFFFFSLDRGEPMHIHVAKGRGYAKFWLQPLELAKSRNLRGHELNEIARLIEEHREEIEGKWNSHFSR